MPRVAEGVATVLAVIRALFAVIQRWAVWLKIHLGGAVGGSRQLTPTYISATQAAL